MKTTYDDFIVMSLRPAFYNGTQFEADISFDDATVYRVGITKTEAVNMIQGDTVKINGKIRNEKNYELVSVYMCGDELSEFIKKFGVRNISCTVRMKLELVYAVYYEDEMGWSDERRKEEMTVYKLIGIPETDEENERR